MSATLDTLLEQVKGVRETMENQNTTHAEKFETAEKRMVQLEETLKRLKNRSPIFPSGGLDAALFRDGGQVGFQKAMNVHAKGLSPTLQGPVHDLQRANDDVIMLAALMGFTKDGGDGLPMNINLGAEMRSTKVFAEFERQRTELQKALDTQTAGEGLEWIPTGFSQTINQLIELELKVPALFGSIDLPQNPYVWPFAKEKPEPQHIGESTTSTGNPFDNLQAMRAFTTPTAKTTFDAEKMRLVEVYTRELSEDAVAPTIPWLRERLVAGVSQGRERVMLNGDTAGTHMDDDTDGATNPVEGMVDGLRDYGINTNANTTAGGATTPTTDLLRATRKSMGVYGVNPGQLVWIMGVTQYLNVLALPEVSTVDKYGAAATLLTGELGRFDGIPIVVSEFQREDVSASGVNTSGGPNTLATIMLVYRPSWMWGRRPNALGLETVRLAPSDQTALVLFDRGDFQFLTANDQDHVALLINVLN